MTINQNMHPRIAFYPGSFNPFTTGHADIVNRALSIFDYVIIGVGDNPDKPDNNTKEIVKHIKEVYKDNDKVDVYGYYGLSYQVAKNFKCCAIIRGARDNKDWEYEYNLAVFNKKFGDIDTIILPASPELMHISSTAIRELQKYNEDTVNQYIL